MYMSVANQTNPEIDVLSQLRRDVHKKTINLQHLSKFSILLFTKYKILVVLMVIVYVSRQPVKWTLSNQRHLKNFAWKSLYYAVIITYDNCRDLLHVVNVLFEWKVNFEKNLVFLIDKFPSVVLPRNAIMLQNLIIEFSLLTIIHQLVAYGSLI